MQAHQPSLSCVGKYHASACCTLDSNCIKQDATYNRRHEIQSVVCELVVDGNLKVVAFVAAENRGRKNTISQRSTKSLSYLCCCDFLRDTKQTCE